MKRCLEYGRDYSDDTPKFCPENGGAIDTWCDALLAVSGYLIK